MKTPVTLIALLVTSITGCVLMTPQKEVSQYLASISYKPLNYIEAAGIFSTPAGLNGKRITLYKDSTFYFSSWGDLVRANHASNDDSGRYFISGDSLLLLSYNINLDSLILNSNYPVLDIINKLKDFAPKHLYFFVYIDDDIFIINSRDKENYIEKYFFTGNVEERIKKEPQKIK